MNDDEHESIAIITLDSLRYDTAVIANTPSLCEIFTSQHTLWHKVYAQATYTLPAHIAMLGNGMLPSDLDAGTPGPYNSDKQRLFRVELGDTSIPIIHPTSGNYPNIVRGFEGLGYRTVGVGGVGWFRDVPSSRFWWDDYFQEFYHQENFRPMHPDSFQNQIALCEQLQLKSRQPLFFFLNIASTHYPYCGFGTGHSGQAAALEYVDANIMRLLELLPRPIHLIICADHGECFGEDGLYGHAFYHPKVMEVPMVEVWL